MWGQNWGQMIWGQAAGVPALGLWAVLLLGAVLGAIGVRLLTGRPRTLGAIVLAFAILIAISVGAVPFAFTNGTPADATKVNANFASLDAHFNKSNFYQVIVQQTSCIAGFRCDAIASCNNTTDIAISGTCIRGCN